MAEISVVPVDVQDDDQCRRVYEAMLASDCYERPWHQPTSFEEELLEWRYDDPAERLEMYAALDGDLVVGALTVWLPVGDNTDKVWVFVRVDPAHRRRGAGSALVQRALERARVEDRQEMVTMSLLRADAADDHPYRRFASKSGFVLSSTEIVRALQLPVPSQRLERLLEGSRPHWEGAYHLETYVDGVPERLRPTLCDVSNQLAVDAPTGDVEYEAETLDPQRYQGYLDLERTQGRRRITTVGVVNGTDQVVAYTDLILPATARTLVWQWGTLVAREHRGHRLGMAVKVANLLRLQAEHPERTSVRTANDDTNSYMVSINLALGFEVVEYEDAYHRLLT